MPSVDNVPLYVRGWQALSKIDVRLPRGMPAHTFSSLGFLQFSPPTNFRSSI